MSQFTEKYMKMNQSRDKVDIVDNPIAALKKGISEMEVRKSLLKAGWPEVDISDVITASKLI